MQGVPAAISTRRGFLSLLAAAPLTAKSESYSTKPARYADPATEVTVYRLTDPTHTSHFPAPHLPNHFRKRNEILFSDDTSGRMQGAILNWRKGVARSLTDAADLDPTTLTLAERTGSFYYWDGPELIQGSISNLRTRVVHRLEASSTRRPGFDITPEEGAAIWVERASAGSGLVLLDMANRQQRVLAEAEQILAPQWRPGRREILYSNGPSLFLLHAGTGQSLALPIQPTGQLGHFRWGPLGAALYLNLRQDLREANQIRQIDIASGKDSLVGKTSQFVQFDINPAGTVFLGASGSAAGPYINLLLRHPVREFPLCEHRSSSPDSTRPTFSPDSQTIFFESDLHGKPALYAVEVEKILEKTTVES